MSDNSSLEPRPAPTTTEALVAPTIEGRPAVAREDSLPPVAEYFGFEHTTCEEVEQRLPGSIRRLNDVHAEGLDPYCYVVNGGDGEMFEMPEDLGGPFQVGVAYIPSNVDVWRLSPDEALAAGAVYVSLDVGVPETDLPAGESSSSYRELEIQGERGIIRRINEELLYGIWFADVPEVGRARVIVSSTRGEGEMEQILSNIETGSPRR
jgi:hypothetical protein